MGLVVESPDGFFGPAGECAEDGHDWTPEFDLGLRDKYLRGISDLGLRCMLVPEAQYGFTISAGYEAAGGVDGYELVTPEIPDNRELPWCVHKVQESSVFSSHIEMMEGEKKLIPVVSTIRFQRFKGAPLGTTELRYEFRPLEVTGSPSSFVASDGKVDVFWVQQRLVALKDGPSKDIQRTAYGVDIGPRLDTQADGERVFLNRYYDIVRRIRICVLHNSLDVILAPDIQPFLEGWQIGFGPI
jgi:hypothetical protein